MWSSYVQILHSIFLRWRISECYCIFFHLNYWCNSRGQLHNNQGRSINWQLFWRLAQSTITFYINCCKFSLTKIVIGWVSMIYCSLLVKLLCWLGLLRQTCYFEMPKKCCICFARWNKKNNRSFYRFPDFTECHNKPIRDRDLIERRRHLWLQLTERNLGRCNGQSFVCSDHFVSGITMFS